MPFGQLRHHVIALLSEVRAVAQHIRRLEMILCQVLDIRPSEIHDFTAVLARQRGQDFKAVALGIRFSFGLRRVVRYAVHVDPGRTIGLDQNLRRSMTQDLGDDLLIQVHRAEVVEDDQVRVKSVDVVRQRLNQKLRAVAADRAVGRDQVGVRELPAQILRHIARPILLGERLAIEHNSHRMALLRRARCQQRHRSLNARAESRRVLLGGHRSVVPRLHEQRIIRRRGVAMAISHVNEEAVGALFER